MTNNYLEWARFVINSNAEPDMIGMAAHVVLAELERLEKGEFICKKCWLRKDNENEHGYF
jgi:hypothetical protein